MDRHPSAASFLGGCGRKLEHCPDLAAGIGDHRPGQAGDLTSSKTSFDAQQDNHAVAVRVSPSSSRSQCTTYLSSAKDLGGLPLHRFAPGNC
jgi:hypothetical protein